ncbi:diguanylate cyclase (GGDEF)-like protein [Salsuginibacillus halophilus]|uniref:Diguanylate cyclase (GGDEF)-like protein n=1 Tax=Salsuginibacillus halophilus TaxID=517424 RepID=A0A2P8H937_9BACI|nr:bifunctional diguanylate cyclase/phosphodiesterase [Salsuginibacillus halophilus]PSL42745.1 diguanylate cyclase (GGDEF)-like protein [Salsuginibacillus halophilus]
MYIPYTDIKYYEKFHAYAEKTLAVVNELVDKESFFISHTDDQHFSILAALHTSEENFQLTANNRFPLDYSICQYLYRDGYSSLTFHDTMDASMTSELPAVQQLNVGCYIGVPIKLENGAVFGTLCAIGRNPGEAASQDVQHLDYFAGILAEMIQYEYDAIHDSSTHLYNEAFVYRCFDHEVQHAASFLNVYYIDIDNFKYVNEAMGFYVAEQLLRHTADRLKSVLAPDSIVARIGGDELLVVTSETSSSQDAEALAERMKILFETPFEIQNYEINVTPSIGVTEYPRLGDYVETLVKQGKLAMEAAKKDGKNTISYYARQMQSDSARNALVANDLPKALIEEQFELYFQPLYSSSGETVTALEALIRWNHPAVGLVSPGEFLPLAEEMGFMPKIDEWVLREACRCGKEFQETYNRNLRISVNLSTHFFTQSQFASRVFEALDATGLPYESLQIEITERHMLKNLEETKQLLTFLQTSGIGVALDDFGKGYSSLNYLRELPIQTLKLDASLIPDSLERSADVEFVHNIIKIAHLYQLKVVAEGIETSEQQQMLSTLGCNGLQGFWLARPASVDELKRRILTAS